MAALENSRLPKNPRWTSSAFGLGGTIIILGLVETSILALVLLLLWWYIVFRPLEAVELIMGSIAALFFLVQNFIVLKSGAFVFQHQDILLMPFYEPFLWGFYFLLLKRGLGRHFSGASMSMKAFWGLLATCLAFSLASGKHVPLILLSTSSTLFLFYLFHEKNDMLTAGFALGLGFIVEQFGIQTGLWHYPISDLMGMPFWFAPMWLSVGLLGRHLLMPLSRLITGRLP